MNAFLPSFASVQRAWDARNVPQICFRRGFVEIGVGECEVDAGFEGGIHVGVAVCGEEHYARVVLEETEEDGDELVALEVERDSMKTSASSRRRTGGVSR